jgi:hypothetical protein
MSATHELPEAIVAQAGKGRQVIEAHNVAPGDVLELGDRVRWSIVGTVVALDTQVSDGAVHQVAVVEVDADDDVWGTVTKVAGE